MALGVPSSSVYKHRREKGRTSAYNFHFLQYGSSFFRSASQLLMLHSPRPLSANLFFEGRRDQFESMDPAATDKHEPLIFLKFPAA